MTDAFLYIAALLTLWPACAATDRHWSDQA